MLLINFISCPIVMKYPCKFAYNLADRLALFRTVNLVAYISVAFKPWFDNLGLVIKSIITIFLN